MRSGSRNTVADVSPKGNTCLIERQCERQCQRWLTRFGSGNLNVRDAPPTGRTNPTEYRPARTLSTSAGSCIKGCATHRNTRRSSGLRSAAPAQLWRPTDKMKASIKTNRRRQLEGQQRSLTYRIQPRLLAFTTSWLRERTGCLGSYQIKGDPPHQTVNMRGYSVF